MSNRSNINHRLLKKIQIIAILAVGMLGGLTKLASRFSRSMKRSTTIVALGTQQAVDALLEIPAIGRNGGNPLANFLGTYPR